MREGAICLSIAGLDPSGGAGILADVKTFETLKVQGFAVATCLTYQNEHHFSDVKWLSDGEIKDQLQPLLDAHSIRFVKIGLIKNWPQLEAIVKFLRSYSESTRIIWDPIYASSSGFGFHDSSDQLDLELLRSIELITPNVGELEQINSSLNGGYTAKELSRYCSVLVKGGHGKSSNSDDLLYTNGGSFVIEGRRIGHDKHGTGCVLSSAILAFLSQGKDLETSCGLAKNYVTNFIQSNESLLGSHSLQHV